MIDTTYLALINAFKRMKNLNGLDKLAIFHEYKEWIVDNYDSSTIFFVRKDPII
mgnify:CR=1 FL=1